MGTVGVILPSYKQPNLLIEAIYDVLRQDTSFDTRILIADDCCPLEETAVMAKSLATVDPRILVCSRITNGGLSANRNTSISYVLAMCPDLEAITFLDADDRLDAGSLQWFYEQLKSAPDPAPGKKVGWVYTDPYQFGGLFSYLKKPNTYSPIWHLLANSNSATSLISIDVLRAGCRFDETMRRGSEDWDFWLQAIRNNFYGRFVNPPTFRYRRRPESMTSDATLYNSEIRSYVAERNSDLYSDRYIQSVAKHDAARYVLFNTEEPFDPKLRYFVNMPGRMEGGFSGFIDALMPARRNRVSFYPNIIVVERTKDGKTTISELLRDDLFSMAERSLAENQIIIVRRGKVDQRIYISEINRTITMAALLRERNDVYAIFLSADTFVNLSDEPSLEKGIKIKEISVEPTQFVNTEERRPCEIALTSIFAKASEAGLSRRDALDYNPEWVPKGITSKNVLNFLLNAEVVSPSIIIRQHAVILLDPRILSTPRHEAILRKIAGNLQKHAHVTILTRSDLLSRDNLNVIKQLGDRIMSLSPTSVGAGEATTNYMGATINHKMLSGLDYIASGAATNADMLVFAGFYEMISIAFARRKKKSEIAIIAFDDEVTSVQAPLGNSSLGFALGYEHAIDHYFVDSLRHMSLASGRGMPRDKVSLISKFGTYIETVFPSKKHEA